LLIDFFRELFEGEIDLSNPETNLKLLKALLNKVFDNFEFQVFHNSVNLLKNKKVESK